MKKMNRGKLTLLGLLLLLTSGAVAQDKAFEETEAEQAYIFTYFDTKKEAAGLCIAYSYDGYTWTAINVPRSIVDQLRGK